MEKIPHELSKKLVLSYPPETAKSNKRVSTDTASAISEALRLFLVDAHRRSVVEAECDEDINLQQGHDESDSKAKTPIGANHVTRIAGDILMDFS